MPGGLQHLRLHLEPVPKQDQDQRDHGEGLHEVATRVELERPQPAPAEDEAGHDKDGGQREQATARYAGHEGSGYEQQAEHGDRCVEELDAGGYGGHRTSVSDPSHLALWLR